MLSYYTYENESLSIVLWILGMTCVIIECIIICVVTLLALLSFYKAAKTLESCVTISLLPLVGQTSLLIIWCSGTIFASCSMIHYYSSLYTYKNVVGLAIVESISNVLNLMMLTMMAVIMMKTSG